MLKFYIMKKILVLFALLLLFANQCFAVENLTFLYINGSNNNDEKMKNWYINGVSKLHPVIKEKFEKNPSVKQWAKENELVINSEPQIFFWGYDSKTDLDFVKERLNISKAYSSFIAYEVRSLLTQFMHDAIWVQKDHNMLPILDELNNQVKSLAQQNQNVVLYGYSAGTFVTYQYMIHKLPYIKLEKFLTSIKNDDDFVEFVKNNPRKDTCLSALMHDKGNLGVLANDGHFVLNQDNEVLKKNYLNIDAMTDLYCAPPNRVKAIVNFASPLPLFYSDLADKNYEMTFYNKYLLKYLMENGLYFLTVNFREDPLGFPSADNVTIEQMEQLLGFKFNNPKGVVYNNSNIWSKRSAFIAHTSYWSARGCFANAIVQSFVDGTKFLYDKDYQEKVLKKKNNK